MGSTLENVDRDDPTWRSMALVGPLSRVSVVMVGLEVDLQASCKYPGPPSRRHQLPAKFEPKHRMEYLDDQLT